MNFEHLEANGRLTYANIVAMSLTGDESEQHSTGTEVSNLNVKTLRSSPATIAAIDPNRPKNQHASVPNSGEKVLEKEAEYLDLEGPKGSSLPMNETQKLCPYFESSGICRITNCTYEHGELCELCNQFCLSKMDPEQRRRHNSECIKRHEEHMELSFAIQASMDKVCGICLEKVLEKPAPAHRFGILSGCNHIFCLQCIRAWRKSLDYSKPVRLACPNCRTVSEFVFPSYTWIEESDAKKELIDSYKKACKGTDCKYFNFGTSECPFGNRCLYLHALPNGQHVDVPNTWYRRKRHTLGAFLHAWLGSRAVPDF